ncbi:MAG: hypothetical protein EPO35_09020, partial [Acidobacteria bacterium]
MRRLLLALTLLSTSLTAAPQTDAVAQTLAAIQSAMIAHRVPDFRLLLSPAIDEGDRLAFELTLFGDDVTNAAVRERDRENLPGGSRVLVEILVDRAGSGEIATWQVNFTSGPQPKIASLKQISSISGLRRLELDTTTAFTINNFTFSATDFRLSMSSGIALVGRTEEGITAIALRGKGRVEFSPFDPIERHQMVRFNNRESLEDSVDAAFIRLNPAEYGTRIAEGSLKPVEAKPADIKNAMALFNQWANRSYNLALGDLSPERWSLLPAFGDALADFHTEKRSWLSYARSGGQLEDVSLFNRLERKNISVYASPAKLATRGRFYS